MEARARPGEFFGGQKVVLLTVDDHAEPMDSTAMYGQGIDQSEVDALLGWVIHMKLSDNAYTKHRTLRSHRR